MKFLFIEIEPKDRESEGVTVSTFLADSTKGRVYATVLRPSVVSLSVVCNVCIVAKPCVLPKNCLKKQRKWTIWESNGDR